MPTFECIFDTNQLSSGIDLCIYQDWISDIFPGPTHPLDTEITADDDVGIITATRFDEETGIYTFFSRDKVKFPPGEYDFKIRVTVGNVVKNIDFKLILHEPCADDFLTPGTDYFLINDPF